MGYYLLIATGLIGPFFLIKYRETIGDVIGEAAWMRKIGGVYNFIVVVAILIFFWAIADVTGTTGVLFGPLRFVIPGMRPEEVPPAF